MHIEKFLKYIPAIAISLITVSAGMILYFILRYGVDVPYMDQWEYVRFFDHMAKGTLSFDELFALQCEYRQFFPNLIFVSLGWLTNWNVRYEMLFIFLMACLISYNIYRLVFFTETANLWQKWILIFLANLFIFAPIQYENWLFGVQIEYFMPILCVTTCMLIAFTNTGGFWKLIICMSLATISTFSSVNGLLCWFIIFPVLSMSGTRADYFKEWVPVTLWIFGTVAAITFYFIDYSQPENFPSTYEFFDHPIDAVKYFFGILGNPIRIIHSLDHIIKVGGVLFIIFMALALYILLHYKNKSLLRNAIPWLMMGLYSLMTAGMVMVGRLGFGVYQSLTSRYTSYTLYLVVATLFLTSIVIQHYSQKKHLSNLYSVCLAFLLPFIVYIKVSTYPVAIDDLKNFHTNVIHGKAGLLFINYFSHEKCPVKIYPIHFDELRKRANILDGMGYLRPGLIKTENIQDIEDKESGKIDYGSFDSIIQLNDSTFKASGISRKPGTNLPADAVLLSYDYEQNKSIFFTLNNANEPHWNITFNKFSLPDTSLLLRAWAFDANTGKAFILKGSHNLFIPENTLMSVSTISQLQ
ncbi:MAG: hypothetical protein PHT69_13320 [Bacteroidales bacterium]|nr:hypothetical protein [Bacteroidales bacterium]